MSETAVLLGVGGEERGRLGARQKAEAFCRQNAASEQPARSSRIQPRIA